MYVNRYMKKSLTSKLWESKFLKVSCFCVIFSLYLTLSMQQRVQNKNKTSTMYYNYNVDIFHRVTYSCKEGFYNEELASSH